MTGTPTWTPGEVLTASDVNTWFVPVTVVKPSTTARASTTTLADDPDLVLALGSNASYYISGVIFYDGPTANSSDLKWTFSVPSGSNGQYFVPHQNLSGSFTGAFASNWTDTLTANTNGVGSTMCLYISGISQTGGSAGNLTFRWAQNSSNGTNDHVQAQSFLTAQRLA
jgi:hypothetical protein